MLTKDKYSAWAIASWSRWEIILFMGISLVVTVLHTTFGFTFLHVPWTPVALIGTAVSFLIGFQNNAAYGRIWEARKIWGGIVNISRIWGMKIKDMVTNEYTQSPETEEALYALRKTIVYRHIAWLIALRHAMRQARRWETFELHRTNKEWKRSIFIPEKASSLEDDLSHCLSVEEWNYIKGKNNKPAAILYLQSTHLRELKEKGLIWEFSFLVLENLLQEMFILQGKSERIKNFPYPRQYATLCHIFVWIFLLLLPLSIVPEFARIGMDMTTDFPIFGEYFVWLAVPFCAAVSWVFHTMQRIGTIGENPFEGSAVDVPISTIARGIEIDLRQLLDEEDDMIPAQFPEKNNVQM